MTDPRHIPDTLNAPRREAQPWKIVLVFTAALALGVGVCGGGLVFLTVFAMGKAGSSVTAAAGASRLVVIARAVQAYAGSAGGVLPEQGAPLAERLRPFGVNGAMLVSPDAPAGTDSFIYVAWGRLKDVPDQSKAVLLFENPSLPGRSKFSVVFVDQHTELLSRGELEELISNITLPDGTRWRMPADKPGDADGDAK